MEHDQTFLFAVDEEDPTPPPKPYPDPGPDPFNIPPEALVRGIQIMEERGVPDPVRPEGMDDETWENESATPPNTWRYEDGVIVSRRVPAWATSLSPNVRASAIVALSPGESAYDKFEEDIDPAYDLYQQKEEPSG